MAAGCRGNRKAQIQGAVQHQNRAAGAGARPRRSPIPRRRSAAHQHRTCLITSLPFLLFTKPNQTRQKFKEAYDLHFAAIIERAEKQALLARHARHVLNLLDDSPIVPGEAHPAYPSEPAGREILNDAEDELRAWQPRLVPVASAAGSLGVGGIGNPDYGDQTSPYVGGEVHPAYRANMRSTSASSAGSHMERQREKHQQNPPYPVSEAAQSVVGA